MEQINSSFPKFVYRYPEIKLPPGIEGKSNLLDAPQGQAVFHTIPVGQKIPIHKHKDSMAVLLSGSLQITLGKEQFTATKGLAWFIPADVPHCGEALENSLLIEFFSEKRFSC